MFAYAAWRLVQAILDPEGETRRDPKKGAAKRVGWATSGAVHGAIGVAALQMAFGNGRGRGEGGWIADLMRWDHGPTIVAIIGVIVAAFAISQIYKAWTLDFTRPLRLTEMSSRERRWAVRIGRAGLFARGLVFTLVGIGMAKAGLAHDAGQASRGVGGALREIASHSYGTVLLAMVAVGLVAYGIHQFVEARYRRIPNHAA
jgi:hypothetical protein